jgi:alanine dehydrogenase
VDKLSLGVIARTRKENERRLPIHPLHLQRIAPELRERIHLEHGYGEPFGISDDRLAQLVAGLGSRQELIDGCDVILLAKPLAQDLVELREGQVLWGWPHCVQDRKLTQVAIDRRLTLIAFEAMNHWTDDGTFSLHVFHKNNELAGYCSVLHAFQLAGRTGDYGPRLRAAVIGSGATARGAVRVLNAHGVHDVDVLTHRDVSSVAFPIPSARLVQFAHDDEDPRRSEVLLDGDRAPLAEFLASHDVIVNCVLQDPDVPGRRGPADPAARHPDRRRVLRRRHGVRVGPAHDVRGADVRDRRQRSLLRRRPQPVLPVGLGQLADQ